MDETLKAILGVNIGIWVTLVTVGWRIITFLSDIRTKTDLMWKDYEFRQQHK